VRHPAPPQIRKPGAWPPASVAQPSPRPVTDPPLTVRSGSARHGSAHCLSPQIWGGPRILSPPGPPPHAGALQSLHAVPHTQPCAATPHTGCTPLCHTPSTMTCCRAPRRPSDAGPALCRPRAPAMARGWEDVGGE
jgi:hypothetical protein